MKTAPEPELAPQRVIMEGPQCPTPRSLRTLTGRGDQIQARIDSLMNCTTLARSANLTTAEVAVARGLVQGLRYAEIAKKRAVSTDTIKSQVSNLLHKTGSRNRTELIQRVLRENLTHPSHS